MQISPAQSAAEAFVMFGIQPWESLGSWLDRELSDEEIDGRPEYLSDALHLWLLTGSAHYACRNDAVTYINAVALIYVEFSTSTMLSNYKPVPPTILGERFEGTTKVIEPNFALPVSLLPEGFVSTAKLSDKQRSRRIKEFIERPEAIRYGFNPQMHFPNN